MTELEGEQMTTDEKRQLFDQWLHAHARGTLNLEASAKLGEVVEAVGALGKAGKLVLEIIVEPAGAGGRTVAIGGRVTAKVPLPAPELGIYYGGDRGTLHRDDPFAQRLPGVPFADTAGEVKVVDPDTGEIRRVEEPAPTPRAVDDEEAQA